MHTFSGSSEAYFCDSLLPGVKVTDEAVLFTPGTLNKSALPFTHKRLNFAGTNLRT